MVTILHTADVHITPAANERWTALETILEIADDEAPDLVTIGGDLFDTEVAAEQLRDSLREVFSDRDYPILTIPGNHDSDAFRGDLFFGENFIPATDAPFDHVVVGDDAARITCLPYTPHPTDDLLIAIDDREPFDGLEFLLLHCSLEAPIQGGVGEEGEQRYFPISKEELAELDFDYYLAGHYHASHRTHLSNDGTFLYPGTPASVTRSETGRRTVVQINTEAAQAVQLRHLDTFHYDTLDLRVTPGTEEDIIEQVEDQVATWGDRNVAASIRVDGYTEMAEPAFDAALSDAAGDIPVDNDTRTVEQILNHPLFEDFESELESREELRAIEERDDYDRETFHEEVWAATLEVFAELSAEETLS